MKPFLTGLVALTRPGNMAVCFLSVFSGGLLAGKPASLFIGAITETVAGHPPLWLLRVCAASVSAALMLAAGNAQNDMIDHAVDRMNAPGRPIPSGMVSRKAAGILALVLAFAGIGFSCVLGPAGIAIATGSAMLLALYNMKLKGVPFVGNFAVAFLGGLAFVYGGIAGGEPMNALVPGIFAMLFHLAREIVKDAADIRGDGVAGFRTIATLKGVRTASWCAAAIFLLLGAAVAIPCAIGLFGLVYMIIVALGIWPVLAWATASSIIHPSEENLRKIAFVLKLDMPVGVIAILVGFQGW